MPIEHAKSYILKGKLQYIDLYIRVTYCSREEVDFLTCIEFT
jgi:hypothetical protein